MKENSLVKKHLLQDIWKKHSVYDDSEYAERSPEAFFMSTNISNTISLGSQYHYTLHLHNSKLNHISTNLTGIHGIESPPEYLQEIFELIHPEDQHFVQLAEAEVLKIISEIGWEYLIHLKSSYCFRMRVPENKYHLFHHQAIPLAIDKNGKLISSLNIHTDIDHITPINSGVVVVKGINHRNDFIRKQITHLKQEDQIPKLTQRERQIVFLLAKGYNSQEIADRLYISKETIRVHRKNMLKKTKSTSSAQLIKKSFEWNLI